MRLLLDESLPRPLADLLTGHDARTVTQMAWTSLSNGALLRQAAGTFDALLTADQRIEFQQNLKTLPMAVIVLEPTVTVWNLLSRSFQKFFGPLKHFNQGCSFATALAPPMCAPE